MSDLARLATAIAKSSDSELAGQLSRYVDPALTPCNHFALASHLLSKRALETRIRPLARSELTKLISGQSNAALRAAWLADERSGLSSAQELAHEMLGRLQVVSAEGQVRFEELTPHDSVRCLTEICYFIRRNWAKHSATGLRTADLKAIAQRLGQSEPLVRANFTLLLRGGHVMKTTESWQVTRIGERWLSLDFAPRWIEMAKAVLLFAGGAGFSAALQPGVTLSSVIRESFPLIGAEGDLFIRNAAAVGLLSAGQITPLMQTVQQLDRSDPGLVTEVSKVMPQAEPRAIVQSDLSVVITGPLTAELWGHLDGFSDSRELGVVSRFVLSLASVTNGLQFGWTAESIEEFLATKSAREVPQPVSFLLRDAARKFAVLKVLVGPERTLVSSDDNILLTQILNEPGLAPLRLQRASENVLGADIGGREVTLALRAAGYPALMPQSVNTQQVNSQPDLGAWVEDWIQAIRASSSEIESKDQLLQLALRAAAPLRVTYKSPVGSSTVTVRVLGVTAQRIRCRELGSEAELTLPQSSISHISLEMD